MTKYSEPKNKVIHLWVPDIQQNEAARQIGGETIIPFEYLYRKK